MVVLFSIVRFEVDALLRKVEEKALVTSATSVMVRFSMRQQVSPVVQPAPGDCNPAMYREVPSWVREFTWSTPDVGSEVVAKRSVPSVMVRFSMRQQSFPVVQPAPVDCNPAMYKEVPSWVREVTQSLPDVGSEVV